MNYKSVACMCDYLHNFVITHFCLNKSPFCFHKTEVKSSFISILHLLYVMALEMFMTRLNSSGVWSGDFGSWFERSKISQCLLPQRQVSKKVHSKVLKLMSQWRSVTFQNIGLHITAAVKNFKSRIFLMFTSEDLQGR
jgi:hypothetical protein